jgi:hypothetical protein
MSTISWLACPMPGCLGAREAWLLRTRTARAMVLLCAAQLAVKLVPFRYWRLTLGRIGPVDGLAGPNNANADGSAVLARRMAVHVERGAARLPFSTKCLPRAMALCWLLRSARIAYFLRIAVRPAASRPPKNSVNPPSRGDSLHAWVECENTTIIGALPGPWLVVLTVLG